MMNRKAVAWMIGAALAAAVPAVLAATRLDEVVARPNPAAFTGSTPPQVEIAVTVSRGQFDRQACDVLVETGDGSNATSLIFAVSDERTKSLRHIYAKPGTYQLKVVAGHGCSGSRTVNVAVQATPDAAPGASGAAAAASSTAAAAEPPAQAGGCPAGWWLVPESVQGAQYSCRPNLPSRPLPCAGGTRYFSENGVIGCR
jgi:hypothetical protein